MTPDDMSEAASSSPAWHATRLSEVLSSLGTDPEQGLSLTEAGQRLTSFGSNTLTRRAAPPWWHLFLDQFRSVLVVVLLIASGLAFVVGDQKDAIAILAVVFLNALLGYYQEHRADAAVAALKQMLSGRARVRREEKVLELDREQVVPGDVVLLEAGDRLPADGRLVVSYGVEVDESALTGEAGAVRKEVAPALEPETALGERVNSVFMNTIVTRGRAEMVVTETGMSTQIGRIAAMLDEAKAAPTPLQVQLDALGKRLSLVAVVIVSLLLTAGLLRGHRLAEELMAAIALAVAAIPEGLPAVVTVTLGLGMQRMARSRAIVKKLAAVETLGCTTVICSDKTGTLTMNQMTARAAWFAGCRLEVTGEGYGPEGSIRAVESGEKLDFSALALPSALCNDACIEAGIMTGDPTEGALMAFASKAGTCPDEARRRLPRVGELPFNSETKLMVTFHRDGDQVRMFVKGATDRVLDGSGHLWDRQGVLDLDEALRKKILAEDERLASQSMRVLAVAERTLAGADFDPQADFHAYLTELTFVGLIGILDPPRPEAGAAIALCGRAGIEVKMITGDHRATAVAIARELGIPTRSISGPEIERLSDEELRARVEDVGVFARVAPEHKLRIVRAFQTSGHVVAMTGDGVNDAPALKAADIGVAMGRSGTEVAKEAAAMVLADDNFATIIGAVKEGRTIYDNIVKFVRFQLSTNIAAMLAVFGASLLGMVTPFTPIQLLWINMIMDGPPALTLGVDAARPGIMNDPPRRRSDAVLTWSRFIHLSFLGFLMALGTLFAFHHGIAEADEPLGLTMAFTTFVLFQVFNVLNARNETGSALNRASFANGRLWAALGTVVVLQIIVVYWPPAQGLFRTCALAAGDWAVATLLAASVVVAEELRKGGVRTLRTRAWRSAESQSR